MSYALRYTRDSDLGRDDPTWVLNTFRTLQAAEAVRSHCVNAADIEIVEVEG